MSDQCKCFYGKLDPNILSVVKALSTLSDECSLTIRRFYHSGLQDTSTCRQLIEMQFVIDAAMKDLSVLTVNPTSLDELTFFHFKEKNADRKLIMDVRECFQQNKRSK